MNDDSTLKLKQPSHYQFNLSLLPPTPTLPNHIELDHLPHKISQLQPTNRKSLPHSHYPDNNKLTMLDMYNQIMEYALDLAIIDFIVNLYPLISLIFLLIRTEEPTKYLSAWGLVNVVMSLCILNVNLSFNHQMHKLIKISHSSTIPIYFNLHRYLMLWIMIFMQCLIAYGVKHLTRIT